MGKYTVYLPGGGSMQVNASSPSAALGNVGGGASLSPQTSSPSGGGGGGDSAPSAPAASSGGGAPQFNTVNGLQTLATMAAQLKGAGWPGDPSDANAVTAAYASTTGGSVTPSGTTVSDTSTSPSGPSGPSAPTDKLGSSIDQLLGALQSGNAAAAKEAAREFDATFGLDSKKFDEAVREYNQNFGLQQAGLTGMYNGEPTLALRTLGLDALKTAADVQADPFREQEVINGLNAGGYSNAIDALTGKTNQPAFQAPHGSAADTRSLGALADRITGGTSTPLASGASGSAGTGTTVTAQGGSGLFNPGSTADGADPVTSSLRSFDNQQDQASLAALPDPSKIVGRNFLKEDPTTQQFALSGESAKTGLPMDTVKSIIQAGMPKFDAPTGMADVS